MTDSTRNIGIFEVDKGLDNQDYWLSKMNLYIEAWVDVFDKHKYRVKGISPFFDEVSEGESVPVYDVKFHPGANGDEDHITVRRLDD